MTSPPGYRRLSPRCDTLQAAMWAWMRTRRSPWTIADLAEGAGSSIRQASRYVRRLGDAGYLDPLPGEREREAGAYVAREWRLARDSGPIAPILIGGASGSGVEDPNSSLSGAALRRARRDSGLTVAQFGSLIGIRDPRTIRRYEAMERVPRLVAERLRVARA